jgi:hypothetical protein
MLLLTVLLISGFLLKRMAPHIRRHITPIVCKMVQDDIAFNLWLQRFRTPTLTAVVKASASTVCTEFYAITLPLMIWCDTRTTAS